MDGDNPSLALKIVLDNPTPKVEFLINLIIVLLCSLLIYIYLIMIDFIIRKLLFVYRMTNNDYYSYSSLNIEDDNSNMYDYDNDEYGV
jgi:hypothetical protein